MSGRVRSSPARSDEKQLSNMSHYRSLAALPGSFRFPAKQDFFQSVDWYECLADTVFADDRVEIFASDESALVVRRTLLGAESYTNFYTMEFRVGPNCRPIIEEFLSRAGPIRVDLRFIPEADARDIENSFRCMGYSVHSYFMHENWFSKLEGQSFDAYLSLRPSKVRNTLKRKAKALHEEHRVRIGIDRTGELLNDFMTVYAGSWKKPEPFPRFLPMLVSTCAKLRILRLGVLYVDEDPAAAQLWITTSLKATIYKLAYREEYRKHSVGTILSAEMFRTAIDIDGVSEIDYGVGSEAYKRDWMDASRRLLGLRAYKRASLLGASLWHWQQAKQLAKAFRSSGRSISVETDQRLGSLN